MTGSAVGPYRLVKTSRPTPPLASSAMHSASSKLSSTRRALASGWGEAESLGELKSASSSGMAPTLAACGQGVLGGADGWVGGGAGGGGGRGLGGVGGGGGGGQPGGGGAEGAVCRRAGGAGGVCGV